ncbi:Rossmann-like domain-containing protein [Methylotuvimicrobium sp.]|uniref:Rossmann-like domain-containing protein n=1 Tax=Methylotuvimicrobium sp. TaxID=2822413 RepID=UPI003D65A11A
MDDPRRIYEMLLDYCSGGSTVGSLTIGLVWTVCRESQSDNAGLCMSPGVPTRTLPWAGALTGKPLSELAAGLMSWDPYQACLAMSAVNCCINARPLPESEPLDAAPGRENLAVFDYFLPQLRDKKVAVVGRYPGLELYREQLDLTVLELNPGPGDFPAAASEYVLSKADWVFLTGSSIPNKTFPRLAELSASAVTVLMGPTVPWLPHWHEFGIDYLAGIEVTDADRLFETAAQGGGVRIFGNGLRYRVAELSDRNSLAWLKTQIAECYAEKSGLTKAMEQWYERGNTARFQEWQTLDRVNARLSHLDSGFKRLWDRTNKKGANG